jgi:hypothetical protein
MLPHVSIKDYKVTMSNWAADPLNAPQVRSGKWRRHSRGALDRQVQEEKEAEGGTNFKITDRDCGNKGGLRSFRRVFGKRSFCSQFFLCLMSKTQIGFLKSFVLQ